MTATVVASQMGEGLAGVILADPTFLSPQRQREVRDSDVAERHRHLLSRDKDSLIAELRIRHPRRSSETARGLQGLNTRVRVERISGAGHGLPSDQPERLAALLTSFARPLRHSRRGPRPAQARTRTGRRSGS